MHGCDLDQLSLNANFLRLQGIRQGFFLNPFEVRPEFRFGFDFGVFTDRDSAVVDGQLDILERGDIAVAVAVVDNHLIGVFSVRPDKIVRQIPAVPDDLVEKIAAVSAEFLDDLMRIRVDDLQRPLPDEQMVIGKDPETRRLLELMISDGQCRMEHRHVQTRHRR